MPSEAKELRECDDESWDEPTEKDDWCSVVVVEALPGRLRAGSLGVCDAERVVNLGGEKDISDPSEKDGDDGAQTEAARSWQKKKDEQCADKRKQHVRNLNKVPLEVRRHAGSLFGFRSHGTRGNA